MIAEDSYPARPAGLFSHLFNDAGIYEILDGERPHLKCVIIVKPIAKQHVVKITNNEFSPGKHQFHLGSQNPLNSRYASEFRKLLPNFLKTLMHAWHLVFYKELVAH